MTLQDLSQITGLAVSTISRILNNDSSLSVKESTRRKVLEAAEKSEYLSKKQEAKTNRLEFLAVSSYSIEEEFNDPYYLSIRLAIEEECIKENIHFSKNYGCNFPQKRKIDGILAIGRFTKEQVDFLSAQCQHIIFIDSCPSSNFDCITPDLNAITKAVMDYFSSCGYKSVGYIGGRDLVDLPDEREEGFQMYAKKQKISYQKYFKVGKFSSESGYQLALELIGQNLIPEALFTANDTIALGVLKALNENHISIPRQTAVVSVNNIPASAYTFPSLSTVKIHTYLMGKEAVSLLQGRIISNRTAPLKIIVPFELILRGSTISHLT